MYAPLGKEGSKGPENTLLHSRYKTLKQWDCLSWTLDAESLCSQNGFHPLETQIAHCKSNCVWISSSRNCIWRDHCQNKLEGSSALQRVQQVFISAFSSFFYKEKVTGKLWRQKQSFFPLGRHLAVQVQQSAWLQFGLQTAHLNQHLRFHTLHSPTLTFILMQPGTEPMEIFWFFPPLNVLRNAESTEGTELRENPLFSRADTYNTSGDSTICSHMIPYEVKGGGRNQCCCCCLHCDCSWC